MPYMQSRFKNLSEVRKLCSGIDLNEKVGSVLSDTVYNKDRNLNNNYAEYDVTRPTDMK